MSEIVLRECLTEVLEGVIAGVRSIAPDTLVASSNTGTDDYNTVLSSLPIPSFDIEINYEAHEDQVMQPSTQWIEKVNVKITTVYRLESPVVSNEDYYAAKAESADVGKQIRTAFHWPGKLTYNDAGDATGISGGILIWESSVITKDQASLSGKGPGMLITEHVFNGISIETIDVV